MKLYVSGPMSGKPAFNIPAFDEESSLLRSEGHDVVSPAELDEPEFRESCLRSKTGNIATVGGSEKWPSETWGSLLARDVKLLADDGIEGIVVLPGWKKSRGALLETFVGRLCGLPIYSRVEGSLLPIPAAVIEAAHALAAGWLNAVQCTPIYECGIKPEWDKPEAGGVVPEELRGYRHADALNTGRYALTEEPLEPAFSGPRDTPFSQNATEVRTVDPETGGEKGEKPEAYDLLPWPSLDEVAKLYAFGATKYQPHNWRRGFRWGLCFASLIRHAHAFWRGESYDPETKCHHLASVVFHALTLMEFERDKLGKDDRAVHS